MFILYVAGVLNIYKVTWSMGSSNDEIDGKEVVLGKGIFSMCVGFLVCWEC